ncbi:hypothetical protein [Streptomyces sp. H39-S7]|uniref:hypothetical protein n=1 Tax=Streptomyces sp. H39-S7 TaxID=3004357 RepID=UPI0022AED9A7|nr:hypothetical protein [Streptomyces sp. H39-S7]MCZ4125991.1 hypothetical protein [Streptomyces sp. H39-S7]
MEWARFFKTDENGRHYFQTYSFPQEWGTATPKDPGTGRISEAAALAYSIICASGFQWQTPCHCVECTIKAKSAQSSNS